MAIGGMKVRFGKMPLNVLKKSSPDPEFDGVFSTDVSAVKIPSIRLKSLI
jgi:hypothetical protein